MEFELNEEQRLLQESVRRFTGDICSRDFVQQLEQSRDFPSEAWKQMAELGLLGLPVTEELGGAGGSMLDMVIVIEELAQGSLALAVPFINSVGLSSRLLSSLGSVAQQQEYLPRIMSGDLLTSFAWTEASGGTDVLSMKTTAKLSSDGDHYVVKGSKLFITQAHLADFIYTMVRTDTETTKKTAGLSCLMIPSDLKGINIRQIEKTGQRSTAFCEIQFDDVVVPAKYLLGDEDQGWRQLVPLLNGERTCFAAVCLGIAEAAMQDAVSYMEQRSAFGKTINHFQALQHYIAEMKTLIDASRLMVYKSAWLETNAKTDPVFTTEAFMFAADMVSRVTDLGMQIMGGYGYTTEFDMERYWRDGRVFRLSPITSEMAKNFIAQGMGMPRSY